jgi:hypothetical protein
MPNSRAFYHKKYKELLAMVGELGMPHVFITITLNTYDPRFIAFLKKYSTLKNPRAEDEPILTAIWYRKMLDMVLDAITGRKENYYSPIFGKIKFYYSREED